MQNPFESREIWFLTGSQGLYGPETLDQVAEQSRTIAETLDAADEIPVKIVWKPVLTSRDAIRETALAANADPACVGVIAWMHTFSPAKMWILGLDALQTPLLHLHTQANEKLPWSSIDMDFMNLNQAAHGDREFGYIAARLGVERKTVVGHASHADVQERIGRWARAATGWAEMHSLRLARYRRQHARRRRHRGRQDRGRAAPGRLGEHVGRQRPRRGRRRDRGVRDRRARRGLRRRVRRRPRAAARAASAASPCATARGSSWACAPSSRRAASAPSPPTSRTSAGCASCPACRSSASWPTASASAPRATGRPRSWCASRTSWATASPAAPPSWRTTPTSSRPAKQKILGAHMLEVSPTLTTATAPPRDPPAGHRRPRGPRAPDLHGRPRPRPRDRHERHARALPPGRQHGAPSSRPTSPCRTCPWPAPSGSPPRPSRPRPSAG
jgi:hypothetical protein